MPILLLETLETSAQERLGEKYDLILAPSPNAWKDISDPEKIQALITRGKGQVTADLLEHFPNLKCIARCGVGLDNIDLAACEHQDIPVLNLPGATTIAVAEQTFFLILACVRNLLPYISQTNEGNWDTRNHYEGDDLYGKTLGLIGMGDIAQQVASMASAFGMKVIYWNHREKKTNHEQVSFDELLEQADILSVHCALTEETKHLINAEVLRKCKTVSYLINTARGGHIDQSAVLDALNSGQLAGFAADVLTPEPPAQGDPLLLHPRSIITPHISALTKATYTRMSHAIVDKVVTLLEKS